MDNLFFSIFGVIVFIFFLFSGITNYLPYASIGILRDSGANNEFYFIGVFFIYVIFSLLSVYLWRRLRLKKGLRPIDLWEKAKYLWLFFHLIPILNLVYPFLLGLSDEKLRKQIKYMLLGLFICMSYMQYRFFMNAGGEFWLGILYFFPMALLALFLVKFKKSVFEVCRYTMILILLFILLTQPLYKNIFSNYENICNAKVVNFSSNETCFKIFENHNRFFDFY